jgi:hypothetical protein
MKKDYQKPTVDTSEAFETLAAGCSMNQPAIQPECEEGPLDLSL